jgi:hypothetical protein
MAENIQELAAKLGAVVVGQVPPASGGAFGAARLAHDVARLRAEMRPVRISNDTLEKLVRIAHHRSESGANIDPLEMAARLLEEAVAAAVV